ncbi:CoA transferase subunit A [Ferrovibrio sp.]|uniref:CoA transferase subunit A n=1 Tax=Ferrovibrio sp. TaxID=1917215 RepID=UPI003511C809
MSIKTLQASGLVQSVAALAAQIHDGAKVAVPPDYSGVAMELTRALIRRRPHGLHLVCVPVSGLQAEMLIGAGCVGTLETSAVTLGEYGTAYRFAAALKRGDFRMLDATCPAVHAAIQAAGKGLPFMPLRGLLGSDLLKNRPDWKVIDNPFADGGDPIVLLPAIRPDFAVFHAPYADRNGNVFIGRRRELVAMAHASRESLVTVEEIRDVDLLASEETAAGTLTAAYIGGIAEAPRGAWPLKLWDIYDYDEAHIRLYCEAARSEDGFARYLTEHVQDSRQAAE